MYHTCQQLMEKWHVMFLTFSSENSLRLYKKRVLKFSKSHFFSQKVTVFVLSVSISEMNSSPKLSGYKVS